MAGFEDLHKPTATVGWLLGARLDADDLAVVKRARARVLRVVSTEVPETTWSMPMAQLRRAAAPLSMRLADAAAARRAHGWDAALLVVDALPDDVLLREGGASGCAASRVAATGRTSSQLGVVVLAVAPLGAAALRLDATEDDPLPRTVHRLAALALNRLLGLQHASPDDDPASWAHRPRTVEELDAMMRLPAAQRAALATLADREARRPGGARAIGRAVRRLAPWRWSYTWNTALLTLVLPVLILPALPALWHLSAVDGTALPVLALVMSWLATSAVLLRAHRLTSVFAPEARPARWTMRVAAATATLVPVAFALLLSLISAWAYHDVVTVDPQHLPLGPGAAEIVRAALWKTSLTLLLLATAMPGLDTDVVRRLAWTDARP
ncbi:MAG: hypothetical protein AAF772_02250 [Acidobacteriota bacterium]